MSFRPSSPHELPNGRLVCSDHFLEVCGVCCTDYSFMDEVLGDDDEEEDISSGSPSEYVPNPFLRPSPPTLPGDDGNDEPKIGTGRVVPQKFTPPNSTDTPSALFPHQVGKNAMPLVHRFIRRGRPTQFLIYTDGACLDNGNENSRAGCGFVFGPSAPGVSRNCSFRLENRGPTGDIYQHTSNRAELRAVIAALRFRAWHGEGFSSLVIATDSDYVVKGATVWVRKWLRTGWKTSTGTPVKNKDLWQALLGEAERWSDRGMTIEFWLIPRNLNTEADHWAKDGANKQKIPDGFSNIMGVLV